MELDPEREAGRFRHPDANSYTHQPAIDSIGAGETPPLGAPRRVGKPPRRKHGGWRRGLRLLVGLFLVAVLAYAAYIATIVVKISTNSLQIGPLASDAAGRTNVLVLGVGDPGHAGENLSDIMMILSLDGPAHRLAQISIPRDLRVAIPGFGYNKINAANAFGGVDLAKRTVSDTFGLPINYYVKTDFSGLKDLVDAVGGVDVMVKQRLVDPEYPCDDNQYKVCGLDIEPGLQHMDGTVVLQYVRCRKGTCGNDFGRAVRQQELLALLRPKLMDPHLLLSPVKLKLLADATEKGIKTDLGLFQILELANSWRVDSTNKPVNLVLSTGTGGYLRSDPSGSSDLLPIGGDFSAISDKIKTIFTSGDITPTL